MRRDIGVILRMVGRLAAILAGAAIGGVAHADIGMPATAWTQHLARGQTAWRTTLDLRALPADTQPGRIVVDADLRAVPVGAAPVLTVAINGRVMAHSALSGGGIARVPVPLDQKLFSVRNRIDVALTDRACTATACAEAPALRLSGIRLALRPRQGDITDFARAVTTMRRGLTVVASPRDRAIAERVVAALAPLAPRRPDARSQLVVGDAPPAGLKPALPLDESTRLESESGRVLYDAAALRRFTVVQLLAKDDRLVIWVRPGKDADLPGRFQLDHGDVALFGLGRREINFSTREDAVMRIVHDRRDALISASAVRMLVVLVGWLLASLGVFWIARRLPKPRSAEA